MRSFLIPFLLLVGVSLFAQEPTSVQIPDIFKLSPDAAEAPCNNAGTFKIGQHIGQSNDISRPQIFLCRNDSIFLDHDGNANFAVDPSNPAIPPGVAYGFYRCLPNVDGPNLAAVDADTCIIDDMGTGNFYLANGLANGDIWLRNSGSFNSNTIFGGNPSNPRPVELYFAPITVYDFGNLQAWGAGANFGGNCVAVSKDEAISVVYLTPIDVSVPAVISSGCRATYKPSGGLYAFDNSSTYDISITGVTNPTAPIHELIKFNPGAGGTPLKFSVEQNGNYRISVSDGKSCSKDTIVSFTGCVAADNVGFDVPDETGVTGTQVCIPILLSQAQPSVGYQFSISWDPSILTFVNSNAKKGTMVFPNAGQTAQGRFGAIIDNNLSTLPFIKGDTIIELCFNVIGTTGNCSPIEISSTPTFIDAVNSAGVSYGISLGSGEFCVTTPGALDMQVFTGKTNCDGTGQIVVVPSGGIPPYEIIYSGPPGNNGVVTPNIMAGDSAFINVTAAGSYSFTLTDQNGAGTTFVKTYMATFPKYVANLIRTSPKCFGGTDGMVEVEIALDNVVISNTSPQFTYNWTGPAGVTLPTPLGPKQNMVPAGAYSVTVTNTALGCQIAPASGGLTEPARLMRNNLVLSPASCSGIPDGSFTYSVKGGTTLTNSTYRYWVNYSASGTPPGTPLINNLQAANVSRTMTGAGTYYITATDANMCTFNDTIMLTAQKELSLDLVSQTNVTCFGKKDGTISMEVTTNPILPPSLYTFSVVGMFTGSQTPSGLQSTTFMNVPAGTYTIFAQENSSGCKAEGVFTVTQPNKLVLDTVTLTNPTCMQGTNGSIEVGATGGTGPIYTYAWTPTHTGSANSLLSPGLYKVTATDVAGCKDSLQFTLKLPPPPSIKFDSVAVKCGGDGCLSVTATPTAPATVGSYAWTNLTTGTIAGSTREICGLSGGRFQIVVTDSEGCVKTDTITLATPNLIKIDTVITQRPSCAGASDGIISATVSGGKNPYTYKWQGSTINLSTYASLKAGSYGLTVTDAAGCSVERVIVLMDRPSIQVNFTGVTGTTCANTADGRVTAVTQYNTMPPTYANYTFQWENSTSTDSIVTDLPGGYNSVTISDPMNCFIVDSILIPSPEEVSGADSYFLPVKCNGGMDGAAYAKGTGGSGGPYTFLWQNGTTADSIGNLTSGSYVVTIYDGVGCEGVRTIDVDQPDPIMAIDSTIDIICANDNNAQVYILAEGGNPGGYTYAWDNGAMGPALFDVGPGTYSVTVTDIEGCTGETAITVNNPLPVSGSFLPWDPLICFGDQTTIFVDTIFGGVGGPYQFTLDYGVELPVDFPVSVGGGWHIISYIDRLGCMSEDSVFVDEPEKITVTFPTNIIEVELGDTTYQLLPTVNPPDIAAFEWLNSEFLSNPDTLRPYAYNNESQTFTLIVTNGDGCMGQGSITVEIDPNRNIYIPNIFNPSSTNGFNDRFTPYVGYGVTEIQLMQVYDRWGTLMFENRNFVPNNNDFSEGWDGNYKGKKAGMGVYVYVVKVLFRDGRVLNYRGDLTLIR